MADTAHRLTDEKLEEMEKRLSAIYSRAEKEIQKTADEYFAKFAKQDEAKRKLLEQGKITEDEYTKWRKGKYAQRYGTGTTTYDVYFIPEDATFTRGGSTYNKSFTVDTANPMVVLA